MRIYLRQEQFKATIEAKSMKKPNDKALMLAVVRRKDRAAFEILYSKFVSESYNVASYILGPKIDADDVVQEAFHAIWESGASFDPEKTSSVRSWVLRIVANKALLALRARKRIKEINDVDFSHTENQKANKKPQQEELIEALKTNLNRIPESNRQCIALYFGARLSQQEVATTLGLPARTVSSKIQKTLKELRAHLSKAGFAALSPEALGSLVEQTVCSGTQLPNALAHWKPNKIPTTTQTDSTINFHQTGKSGTLYLCAGLTISLCIAFGVYLKNIESPTEFNAPEQPPSLAQEASNANQPNQIESNRIFETWTFEKPASDKYFKVLSGKWQHTLSNNNIGVMEVRSDKTVIQLLLTLRLPLKLTIRAKAISPGALHTASGDFLDTQKATVGFFRNATLPHKSSGKSEHNHIVYLSTQISDHWVDQNRAGVAYSPQNSTKPFILRFNGRFLISRIEIQELKKSALPDTSIYKAAINRIPPQARVGSVAVPEMSSVFPDRKVWIEFFPNEVLWWRHAALTSKMR